MQIKLFTIPVMGGEMLIEEMNVFLRSKKVLNLKEQKERQICASTFGEQVLHHALMNVCHEHFERMQVFDSYASRKGKGTYAALERAKTYTNQYEWYLKLDVRKFFESISHEVLVGQDRFQGQSL